MGCHFLLQCMKVKSESEDAQSCLTLSHPMDCSLPGSSVCGIFQARVLEWGAVVFSVIPMDIKLIYSYTNILIYIYICIYIYRIFHPKEAEYILLKSTWNLLQDRLHNRPQNTWWKCKLVQPVWKTVWRFFQKQNTN